MSAQKDRVLETLRAQVKARKFNKLAHFVPYEKQKEFVAATLDNSEVVLQAGNQVGKSEIGAYSLAVHLTGLYPPWWTGRRFDHPIKAWCCGESSVAVRDVAQTKLCGTAGDPSAYGSGMIPKECLVERMLGHGASGALDTVHVRHVSGGISTLAFKSYEAERQKFQGATLHVVWMDEEPPLDIYLECKARTIATDGLMFSTLTPLLGIGNLLSRFREGVAGRVVVRMRLDDAPHLADPVRREALLSAFPKWQHRARILGLPLMGEGAVFGDIQFADISTPLRIVDGVVWHDTIGPLDTSTWRFIWGVDFGISHPFAAALIGHDPDTDRVYVLATLRISNQTPPFHASAMKQIAAGPSVAYPHDGEAREKSSGMSLASMYRREGMAMLGQHATWREGGYSFERGIQEMIVRMQTGRLQVAAHLHDWQEEFETLHRKDGVVVKVGDDILSATRVALMQLRSAKPVGLGSTRRRDRGPEIAAGTDFDLFAT